MTMTLTETAMKRKRGQKGQTESVKRLKIASQSTRSKRPDDHRSDPTVLRLYYPQVLTLREYLWEAAKTSKNKKRRISSYGIKASGKQGDCDHELVKILDTMLVGCHTLKEEIDVSDYQTELSIFSQRTGSTMRSSGSQPGLSFAEIVDFSIWLLFRNHTSGHRPPHILCHGYTHAGAGDIKILEDAKTTSMNGMVSYSRNEHVSRLKSEAWSGLPALVGAGGTQMLVKMLRECGLFVPLEGGKGNYLQFSGVPLSELRPLDQHNPLGGHKYAVDTRSNLSKAAGIHNGKGLQKNSYNSIRFVRHRMLYKKPDLNAKGQVAFGLPQIHVLNRTRNEEGTEGDLHALKYIFPRQFGLHNAFTSNVDPKESAAPFKDYTLREQEIKSALKTSKQRSLPKRLRGECELLVGNLRTRHGRCAYSALLRYYCPDPCTNKIQPGVADKNVMNLATSPSQVSAFCRAVVNKVFPGLLWGEGEAGKANKARIMHQIDRFVKLNRYESLMIHEVLQDMKISEIPWLRPPNQAEGAKMAASDFAKRKELFAELLYYLFDSFVVPLIASNFHVTESSSFRNRVFYFRHDVWKKLSEPALTTLRSSMFEELGQKDIRKTLSRRAIGTSRVRLLPKDTGLRPIINLRRRVQTQVNGKLIPGRSINSILTPAFHVLNFEKMTTPQKLGSSMFSADDIYVRLQQFRTRLEGSGQAGKPLYFAKVDVRSCFDTIPQKPLLQLLNDLLSAEEYNVTRHAEAKALGDCSRSRESLTIIPKAVWKFLGRAQAANRTELFSTHAEKEAATRMSTVFVDSVIKKQESRIAILSLLREHVERNVVQIGKKFYRQKTGIPQGSIVSSLLCNFFYAELEREVLGFVHDGESVLLRLIDDFLLISTSHDVACRFIQTMHAGIPHYGLAVKSEKSKVNFDVQVDGAAVARLPAATSFPYCGNAIDTVNLNITKDETRRQQNNLAAAVTVEYSRLPGQNFYRKTFNMLKLHMHAMHMCTQHNHVETVIANVHRMFADTAERCFHYIRCLPQGKRPPSAFVIKTIDDLITVGFGLMQRKKDKSSSGQSYACSLSKSKIRWLACDSFERIFERRQTGFRGLLSWLRQQRTEAALACSPKDKHALEQVVRRTWLRGNGK